jgi:hypothetical protein
MQSDKDKKQHNPQSELIISSSVEILAYLERAIPELEAVAQEIRNSSSVASVLTELDQLSEGLDLINVYLNSLNAAGVEGSLELPKLILGLSQSVTSMHDFIRDGDARSMGAALTNELIPSLTDIKALSSKLSRGQ